MIDDLKNKYPKLTYKQMLALNDIVRGHKLTDIGRRYGYKVDEKYRNCPALSKLKRREDAIQYMNDIQDEICKIKLESEEKEQNLYLHVQDVVLSNWVQDMTADLGDFIEVKYYKKSIGKDTYINQPYLELKKPLDEIPAELRRCIKTLAPDTFGIKIELYDRHKSEMALAQVAGLFRNNDEGSKEDIQSTVDSALNGDGEDD